MQTFSSEQLDAVFLFDGENVVRELHWPEFEALLDGFIPVGENVGPLIKAVMVRVNARLHITAAVFFVLSVDSDGMVSRQWNVPFFQLLDMAAHGPDLGAGPIKLVCFSQCPLEWQRNNLWDPHMEPGNNSFSLLRKRVAANTPGLLFREPEEESPAADNLTEDHAAWRKAFRESWLHAFRDRLARVIREQRLRIATLTNEHKKALQARQQEHQQRLAEYQQSLQEKEADNLTLGEQLAALQETVSELSRRLAETEAAAAVEVPVLTERLETEDLPLRDTAADLLQQLQDKLDHRELELFYRQQQENNLTGEIAWLRDENARLIEQGGDYLLQRLQAAGVSFVTVQPGVGAIDLGLDEIAVLLDTPHAIAARRAGISESLYLAWLEHWRNPACAYVNAQGDRCDRAITRCDIPVDFIIGETDSCEGHQSHARMAHG